MSVRNRCLLHSIFVVGCCVLVLLVMKFLLAYGFLSYNLVTCRCLILGIEFYLFVSHGGMNDRGSTCKFRNLHVDPLSFIPPWETNKYNSILVFILHQNCPVLAMKYPFLNTQQGGIQNSRRSSRLIRHVCFFMEKWMSKFFLCSS